MRKVGQVFGMDVWENPHVPPGQIVIIDEAHKITPEMVERILGATRGVTPRGASDLSDNVGQRPKVD